MNDRRQADGVPILAALAQQRLWFLAELDPSSPAYNEPLMVACTEPIDEPALSQALSELLRRHQALRTVFFSQDGQVMQKVLPFSVIELPIVDLRALPEREREAESLRIAIAEARQPFDLAAGPLFRATLMRLGDSQTRLFLTAHHLVIDGLSYFQVLIPELHTLYNAFAKGQPSPLAELPLQYTDFAEWQRSWLSDERLAPQLAYWKAQLAGVSDLDLPTDFPRSAQPAKEGARHPIALSGTLSNSLKSLSRHYGVSLFTVILAAWKTLLYRHTGQSDVVVGTAVAGRRRQDLGQLIGFFTNSLVLRTQLDGDLPFGQLLGRVREVLEAARQHQDVPFERLVAELDVPRTLHKTPLFNTTCIVMPPTQPPTEPPHFAASRFDIGVAKLDLYLELHQRSTGLAGHIEYRSDLFRESTVARMAGHLQILLAEIARDPEQPLRSLRILSPAEEAQLASFRCGVPAPADLDAALPFPRLFEQQAARTPEALALMFEAQRFSYRELNERANQLAHHLRGLGVKQDVLVGIFLERSPEAIIALLAIQKAGGAYVPLDPAYPKERLRFMMEDAELPLLLTQSSLRGALPALSAQTLVLDLELELEIIAKQSAQNLSEHAAPHHLAYTIYTSGSTGKPKGVLIEHRGLSELCHSQRELFSIGPGSRVLQFTSPSFDVSVGDLTMALSTGATLVLASNMTLLPGAELAHLLDSAEISILALPPSALAALPQGEYPALRTLIVGGEPVNAALLSRFAPFRKVHIAYGLTECTVMSTCGVVNPAKLTSIGKPISGVEIYILDSALQQVPVGIAGEIYLGGSGLGRGYLRRPELTAERFIENPIASDASGKSPRLFRTGDRGRFLPDGEIEFLGRNDRQIKLRGFRIELAEIDALLSRHPAVREAVVLVHDSPTGDKQLAAYVVARQELSPNVDLPGELATWLKSELPESMIPSSFTVLEALPLSPTGKLERSALPPPAVVHATRPGYEAPNSEIEQAIIAVWHDVLRWERIGVRDNFFDLGGHSLLLAQVQSRLQLALSRDIRMLDLFRYPTVHELAVHLSSALPAAPQEGDSSDPGEKPDANDPLTTDSRERARRQRSALHRSTRARRRSPQ